LHEPLEDRVAGDLGEHEVEITGGADFGSAHVSTTQ
jgi:hypothetical protein